MEIGMAETVDDADPFPMAYAIAEQAINRDPRKATIGILMGDRTLGVGTIYRAYWFDTPDELADFIESSFSYLATNWEDEEYMEELASMASEVRTGGISKVSAELLDHYTLGHMSVPWVGNFPQMCSAGDPVSQKLIHWFRDGEAGPLSPDEHEDFIEFLVQVPGS